MSSQNNNPLDCRVYNQYTGTNLEAFIKKVCSSFHDSTTPFHEYFSQINNLSIAKGSALDLFGQFLNFNRYITFNDPLDIVRPNTEGIDEYLVITQRDNDIVKQCRLGDDAYRTVLRLLMESRNTMSSVVTLSRIISSIVDADVFVGDNMNMAYITYYFLDRIPGWLEVTMHNYDILPRPAGMSAEYISAFSRFFGFLIADPHPDRDATAKVFSGFWKARFPDIAPKQITLPYSQLLQTNYTPAPLTQDQYTQLLHQYTTARTADEVTIRDINTRTRQLEAKAVANDHKYMYIPKSHQGIIFPHYVKYLEATDSSQRTSFSWLAKHQALTAFIQNTEAMHRRYLTREVWLSKKDPRHNLYYDHKSHFYFYSPPDSQGNFNPYTLANLYQDACGVWYPQDDLLTQLRHGYITLRRDDYASSQVTKTIDTSPLLDKFRPFWLQNGHTIDADPTDRDKLAELLSNFHLASKYFAKVYPIHLTSFRAALDMEYEAASLMKFAESIYNKIISRPGSRSQEEVDYFRDIYRRIMDYYGTSGSYYYFYRDYDKKAPVYHRRTFIKTQRYLVMETINKLTTLYTRSASLYSELSKYTTPSLESTIYSIINDLKTQLQTNPWLSSEIAGEGWGYTEAYSAKNLRNDQVEYYLREAEKGKRGNEEFLNFSRECQDACSTLRNRCDNQGWFNDNSWEQQELSFKCYVNPDYTYIPKRGDSNMSWDSRGWFYIGKEGGRARGCDVAGYRSFNNGWWGHYNRIAKLESELERRKKEVNGLRHERDNRTEVTKDRTLEDVIRFYNSYIPPSEVPPPPDPHYDITIDYPHHLETDYGAYLYSTQLAEEREARGLENIEFQTALQESQDTLLGLPSAGDFDQYPGHPQDRVEYLQIKIDEMRYRQPRQFDFIREANRLRDEHKRAGTWDRHAEFTYSPEALYKQAHDKWFRELSALRSQLAQATLEAQQANQPNPNNPDENHDQTT